MFYLQHPSKISFTFLYLKFYHFVAALATQVFYLFFIYIMKENFGPIFIIQTKKSVHRSYINKHSSFDNFFIFHTIFLIYAMLHTRMNSAISSAAQLASRFSNRHSGGIPPHTESNVSSAKSS